MFAHVPVAFLLHLLFLNTQLFLFSFFNCISFSHIFKCTHNCLSDSFFPYEFVRSMLVLDFDGFVKAWPFKKKSKNLMENKKLISACNNIYLHTCVCVCWLNGVGPLDGWKTFYYWMHILCCPWPISKPSKEFLFFIYVYIFFIV